MGTVTDDDGSTEGYGDFLYFSGGDDWPSWNSDNSDPLWIARYNADDNISELRVGIGDDTREADRGATDSLVIGGERDGTWYPRMTVLAAGEVGIGTTEPQAQLHVAGSWLLGAPDAFPDFGVSGWLTSEAGNLYEAGGENWAHFFSAYGGGDIVGFGTSGGVGQLPDTKVIVKNSGNVGIGTMDPNDALDVVGDIDATGCVQTGDSGSIGGTCVSDVRLKENIQSLSTSLDKITRLNPVTFEWKEEYHDISHDSGAGIGLIGQEVERVFPHLVTTDEKGYKSVRYDIELQMHMLQAIKELAAENEALKSENAAQQQQITALQQQTANLEDRLAALEQLVADLNKQ